MEEDKMPPAQQNNPLHGLTLETIVTDLAAYVGWEKMAKQIPIKCFSENPSVKSSLTFLRKNPWARQKVEYMYVYNIKRIEKGKAGLL
ncbi:MAG TPA: VF530 family protein [Pelobium sp.]